MQNIIQKFRQISIVFEKPGILSENLKTLTTSNILQFNIFCWNFAHAFYLPMSTKGCVGFFLNYLDLELFVKIYLKTNFKLTPPAALISDMWKFAFKKFLSWKSKSRKVWHTVKGAWIPIQWKQTHKVIPLSLYFFIPRRS